ncbi:hypothetical protein [Pseudomonas purpurea]|uniref:hypothetical protein n=1 Tax=Pseudomonas purpurea TaxID=3136737 RepID=UPI0032672A23
MVQEYSLADVLERIYENQPALETAVIELTLRMEQQGSVGTRDNVRGGISDHREDAGRIKQGLGSVRKVAEWRSGKAKTGEEAEFTGCK